jgi:hypothetical protein
VKDADDAIDVVAAEVDAELAAPGRRAAEGRVPCAERSLGGRP